MWKELGKTPSLATSYCPVRVHIAKQGNLGLNVSASELAQ